MTPEDKSRETIRLASDERTGNVSNDKLMFHLTQAIRDAVAEEREACVETASDVFLIGLSPSEQALELRVKINVASDIRARKP